MQCGDREIAANDQCRRAECRRSLWKISVEKPMSRIAMFGRPKPKSPLKLPIEVTIEVAN